MTETKNQTSIQGAVKSNETALMIDGLYNYLTRDLQKLKAELSNELKYNALQSKAIHEDAQKNAEALVASSEKASTATVRELRYTYQQNQAIYEALAKILNDDIIARLDTVDGKLELLSAIDETLVKLSEKLAGLDVDLLAESIKDKVIECFPAYDEVDYEKITDSVAEKTEASVAEHSRQVLDAVAAIPVAENVDYTRIVEEVGDRVLEIVNDAKAEEKPVAEFDYDKVVYETAEKVIESLPAVEKIDYAIVTEEVQKAVAASVDTIAEAVIAKLPVQEEFDYDKLAVLLLARMPAPAQPEPIDYEKLADMVAERMKANQEDLTQEVVIDTEGAQEIASEIGKNLDLGAIATLVAQKVTENKQDVVIEEEGVNAIASAIAVKLSEGKEEESVYEMSLDEKGVEALADAVAKKLCAACEACQLPVEEVIVEEPAPVEEIVEEPALVEEVVEEPVKEELAVTAEPAYQVTGDELVDAETGLVLRMKKSFVAKMKQSDDAVKTYYSEIKNCLSEYKKVNSNVSWHGDRFNYGRDTVARINIVGKTLGLYLALDPEDPEFKTTVYHQKNVGNQKAYENTPFMVKIKSDAAMKKALRLVAALAAKLGAEKVKEFTPVDYVAEYAYATTQELLDDGQIKVTKEKKVALNF